MTRLSFRAHVAPVAVFAVIVVVSHAPGLVFGPTLDGAVFTELAVGLRSGLLPYRDLWDHKPPGVYVAFAIAQAVLPGDDPWLGPWLLSVLASVLLAALVYGLLLRTSRRAALLGGAMVAAYVSAYPLALGGGQTEPLAAAAALSAFAFAARGPRTAWRALLCGVCVGVAVLTSLLAVPVIFALGIVLARPGAGAVKPLVAFAAGGLLVAALCGLALVGAGIGTYAWSALVTYNAVYADLNRGQTDRFIMLLFLAVLFLAPLLAPCALAFLRWIRTREVASVPLAAAVWVVGGSVAILTTGWVAPHYLIAVIPPLVILAVPAGRAMFAGDRARNLAAAAIVGAALTVAALAAFLLGRITPWDDGSQVRAVATWMSERTAGGHGLFVWGNEPALYYESGLEPATPFVYVYPILTPGFGGSDMSECLSRTLAADPPKFVVDAGSSGPGEPGIVPLLVPRPVVDGERSLDTIEPIREVVRQYYGEPTEVDGWLVYERLAGLSGEQPLDPGARVAPAAAPCTAPGALAQARQVAAVSERSPTTLRW